MSSDEEEADQAAWDAAKPVSRARDKHGREELLMHPYLKRGSAQPRTVTEAPTDTS